MRSKAACILAACIGAVAQPAAGADLAGVSLGTGLNYSSGDYGTGTSTDILSIPLIARYERDRWLLKLTVSYLEVSGGTDVVPGVGAIPNTNPRRRGRGTGGGAGNATVSGIGDTVLTATYGLVQDSVQKLGIDLTGRLKVATADEDEGLGTGEHDFGVQADVYKTIERTTYFGGIGYTVLGSSPHLRLEDDAWNVNLGASYKVDERDSAGLMFDTRQRLSAASSPLRELTAFWVRKLDSRWQAQVYFLKGFSDGSPDWGTGAFAFYAF